jgi:hypothetical protein
MRSASFGFAIILIFFQFLPVKAAPDNLVCPYKSVEWAETSTPFFSYIYPLENDAVGKMIHWATNEALQEDYEKFVSLFEESLSVPITIRIYPDMLEYQCLNALAPELAPETYHTHIGIKEIAVIGERVELSAASWRVDVLNALRHETAALFVQQITDAKAPPGLLAGVGAYAEDPIYSFGARTPSGTASDTPNSTWRVLWERTDISQDRGATLQATSIVAYLVDVYGWSKFLEFLESLATAESYRNALVDTYGVQLSDLQDQWELFYPLFFEGRWRSNVFYDFDLSPYDQLLAAGAYADVAEDLKEVIAFLEDLGRTEKVERAKEMLQKAQIGQEAGGLVRQSRQALQEGDYERSIALADQAEQKYNQIGDSRRLSELDEYRSWATEVLKLRTEIDEVYRRMDTGNELASVERLNQVGRRLSELGDDQGLDRIRSIFAEIERSRQARATETIHSAVLLLGFLILIRILLIKISPTPEAQIL